MMKTECGIPLALVTAMLLCLLLAASAEAAECEINNSEFTVLDIGLSSPTNAVLNASGSPVQPNPSSQNYLVDTEFKVADSSTVRPSTAVLDTSGSPVQPNPSSQSYLVDTEFGVADVTASTPSSAVLDASGSPVQSNPSSQAYLVDTEFCAANATTRSPNSTVLDASGSPVQLTPSRLCYLVDTEFYVANATTRSPNATVLDASSSPLQFDPSNQCYLVDTEFTVVNNSELEPWSGDEDSTPPELAISSPAPGTTTHSQKIAVTGTATDESGIASVTVNGVLASGASVGWSIWSAEVGLTEGENTLTAVATDNAGLTTTKTVTVTYEPLTAPPTLLLSTTLSSSYAVGEPVVLGVSIENTGASTADATVEVTTTSGFSETRTVTVAATSSHSESFEIGSSVSGGSYTATVNLFVNSALLSSSSKSFTVADPAAVRIVEENAETLKRTAVAEFDEMAGVPATASSKMIYDFGFEALQQHVGDYLGTATGEVQKEAGGSITDSDLKKITDEADSSVAAIRSGVSSGVSSLLVREVEGATGVDLPEGVDILDLKGSVTAAVYERIEAAFEDIFAGVLKKEVVKPLLTDGEERKVEQRDGEFEGFVESTHFSLISDEETKLRQRFNAGCGAVASVTESKALFTVGPYFGRSYAVTLGEERDKFEEIDRLGVLAKRAISALVVTCVVFTFLVTVLGTGGAVLLPLISAIPNIISFLTTLLHSVIPVAKVFLIVGMFATVSVVAPDVKVQHGTTLETVEDILTDIAASEQPCSAVSVSEVSPLTSSFIGQPPSVTVRLKNEDPAKVQPITEIMIFSPDGRIIDIQRHDPEIAPLSSAEITQRLHTPSKPGTYKVLGVLHAGGVATSVAGAEMSVRKPLLEVDLSTEHRIYNPGETVKITANFTNSEPAEIGNLTYILEVLNTTAVDADAMVLAPTSTQTKTLSFTPAENGSYTATATLLLGFTEVASETIGFAVGSGEGLVLNIGTAAEDLYPPESDVVLPLTVENIGTVHTNSTLTVATFDELADFSEVYASEIPVSLAPGDSATLQATVLPKAPPGIYRTILTAGDYSAQSVEFTVSASGTLFTLLSTDKLFYNRTDAVKIKITTNDALFNATNASVSVSVLYPNGTVKNLAVAGTDGNYTAAFTPTANGTYKISAESQKPCFKTYGDETFVVVGARSRLNADTNITAKNLTLNRTVFFKCKLTNEHEVPVENAIVRLTGCGINATALTDEAGTANLVVTPNATGTVVFTAEKGGFAEFTSTIFVFGLLENEPPVASFMYSPANPNVNQTITFNGSASYDSEGGEIVNYEWDFGDGTNGTGEIVTHSYSTADEYTVKLTVTDSTSQTNSTAKKILIQTAGTPDIVWNLMISASNQLEPVVVGMHPNASDGYDAEFDAFAETPVQGKVILILDGIYAKSVKKTRSYNETVSWNLSVGVPAGERSNLSWSVPQSCVNLKVTEGEGGEVLQPGAELSEGSHELVVTARLVERLEFSLELSAGWNMVSLPVFPENGSVGAVFGAEIPTLEAMPVVTWSSPSFVAVEEVEPKRGYWVFTPAAVEVRVAGKPIEDRRLSLEAGWNMLGTVGLESLNLSAIPNQVPERPAVTWVAPSFVETAEVKPGKSAWVFVTSETIVTKTREREMPPPPTLPTRAATTTRTEKAWSLTITATNQLEPVTFGVHPNASDGYDAEFDELAKTPVQGKVVLILDEIYGTELNKDRQTWNLSVGVPTGERTTLRWDTSKIPADVALTLDRWNMKLQNSRELGEGSHLLVIK